MHVYGCVCVCVCVCMVVCVCVYVVDLIGGGSVQVNGVYY